MTMTTGQRWTLITVGVALLSFGIGAGWQYTRAAGFESDLDRHRRDLTFQRLENTLAVATIEAQRGRHEVGRQLASDFFTGLQSALAQAPDNAAAAFEAILSQRDATITSLSRAEPQSAAQLAQIFMRYRIALGEPVGPAPTPGESATPADTAALDTTPRPPPAIPPPDTTR
jgi:hypothetical protein